MNDDRHNMAERELTGVGRRTTAELSQVAARLYADAPLIKRKLQEWRPYICPFDAVMKWVPSHANVLDVGCGCGLLLMLLADSGRSISGVGFDLSQYTVDIARQAILRLEPANQKPALEFMILDAAGKWPAGPFDVVSMIDVLHHIPVVHQKEVFMQACQRLAPGGHFVYKDMCKRPMWRAAANRLHDLLVARQWIHYVEIAAVEQWAREGGLQVVDSQRINLFCYGHDLRVFKRV